MPYQTVVVCGPLEGCVQAFPSEVVRVLPLKNGGYDVARVYQNDGKELSGSSVAASWKNRLLVGAIYENFFLDGTLPPGKSLEDARR